MAAYAVSGWAWVCLWGVPGWMHMPWGMCWCLYASGATWRADAQHRWWWWQCTMSVSHHMSHAASPASLAGPGRSWVRWGAWMRPGRTSSSHPAYGVELAGSTIGCFCTTDATPLFNEGMGDSLACSSTHTGAGAGVLDDALVTSLWQVELR
jgi:hypothetical protein